jgi:hypothetical protein
MVAEDDQFYVVKFANNPQGQRVLINELICSELLKYLELPTPEWSLVEVPHSLIERDRGLVVGAGIACSPGVHFGSRLPVDPTQQAIYDYLPASMRATLYNRADFLGMLAFDQWVANADQRQAVFFRGRREYWSSNTPADARAARTLVYGAVFIDHGLAFNGPSWRLPDQPCAGVFACSDVYGEEAGIEAFEPWIDKIACVLPHVIAEAMSQVPGEWLRGDRPHLNRLLKALYGRRGRVAELVLKAREAMTPSHLPKCMPTATAQAITGRATRS